MKPNEHLSDPVSDSKLSVTSVCIRPACAEDAEDILGLIAELAEYEKLSHEVVNSVEQIQSTLFGEEKVADCFVADLEGEIVGMAIFFWNYSTFLGRPGIYLEDLYVKQIHRGKGIGKSLLKQVARLAVEKNCGRLEWSVLDWNQPSIEFYESLEAKPMSGWTVYRLTGDSLLKLGS